MSIRDDIKTAVAVALFSSTVDEEKAEKLLLAQHNTLLGLRAELKIANERLVALGFNIDNGRALKCNRCGETAYGVCTHIANQLLLR